MAGKHNNPFFSKTFSLIELMLVVSIIAILAILIINIMSSARIEAKASKILDLAEAVKHSCKMYESDTGTFVQSSTAMPFDPLWQGLTQDDGSPGWNGPYMQEPLTIEDNPFRGMIWVAQNINADYDLDGDGSADVAAGNPGNAILFYDVPEKAAQYIDASLDRAIAGDWKVTGRVRYEPGPPLTGVAIYLIGGR
ncbi:MAG: hypothetical protein JW867_00320 [Candidatus Omnitrophica bacterium]|nr:hypothetical protein [Candidatus Omnitrophota bacterium]